MVDWLHVSPHLDPLDLLFESKPPDSFILAVVPNLHLEGGQVGGNEALFEARCVRGSLRSTSFGGHLGFLPPPTNAKIFVWNNISTMPIPQPPFGPNSSAEEGADERKSEIMGQQGTSLATRGGDPRKGCREGRTFLTLLLERLARENMETSPSTRGEETILLIERKVPQVLLCVRGDFHGVSSRILPDSSECRVTIPAVPQEGACESTLAVLSPYAIHIYSC